jgi:fatty acid desaturase
MINFTFNKYQFNQLLFVFQFTVFVVLFLVSSWLSYGNSNLLFKVLVFVIGFIISTINLHYFSNLLHLASHNLLSKNRRWNDMFGWICATLILPFTFIDFKITHLEHHKHQGDIELDPDYRIVKTGSIWLLPLRIVFYKDYFFFKLATAKQKWNWIAQYCFQRLVQFTIIGCLFYQTVIIRNYTYFSLFMIPLCIVGVMNAMFLYFYPHYTNDFETKINKFLEFNKVGILNFPSWGFCKLFVWGIALSRDVHEKHHQRPSGNLPYYPEWYVLIKQKN